MSWDGDRLRKRPALVLTLLAFVVLSFVQGAWALATGHVRSVGAQVFFLFVQVVLITVLSYNTVRIQRDRAAARRAAGSGDSRAGRDGP